MSFFICNVLNVNSLKCVSINKQDNKIKPKILNINGNEPLLYLYNIPVKKCSGSCNNINDSYTKSCVPYVAKSLNVKVFNLMSRTN